MPKRVCLGAIAGCHGVRGAVKVKAFTADPEAVAAYGPVEDEAGKRQFRLKIIGGTGKKDVVRVQIEGVRDRNEAEALKGTRLYVDRAALPEAEEDEFYHADLIGLRVEMEDGKQVGVVHALHDFGAGEMVEVKETDGKLTFLPFTKACVPVVDIKGGRLVIVPPDEVEPEGREEE